MAPDQPTQTAELLSFWELKQKGLADCLKKLAAGQTIILLQRLQPWCKLHHYLAISQTDQSALKRITVRDYFRQRALRQQANQTTYLIFFRKQPVALCSPLSDEERQVAKAASARGQSTVKLPSILTQTAGGINE